MAELPIACTLTPANVKVGPADRGGRETDNCVGRLSEHGTRSLFPRALTGTAIHQAVHLEGSLGRSRFARRVRWRHVGECVVREFGGLHPEA